MDIQVDHECEAVHCPICCPVRRAYDEGWTAGHSWADGMRRMVTRGPVPIVPLVVLILVFAVWLEVKRRDRSTGQ